MAGYLKFLILNIKLQSSNFSLQIRNVSCHSGESQNPVVCFDLSQEPFLILKFKLQSSIYKLQSWIYLKRFFMGETGLDFPGVFLYHGFEDFNS